MGPCTEFSAKTLSRQDAKKRPSAKRIPLVCPGFCLGVSASSRLGGYSYEHRPDLLNRLKRFIFAHPLDI
jgi:hypothetical protein